MRVFNNVRFWVNTRLQVYRHTSFRHYVKVNNFFWPANGPATSGFVRVILEMRVIYDNVFLTRERFDFLPSGQLSKTCWAMSPAESLGLKRNSFVFPLTSINRRLICNKTKHLMRCFLTHFTKMCLLLIFTEYLKVCCKNNDCIAIKVLKGFYYESGMKSEAQTVRTVSVI